MKIHIKEQPQTFQRFGVQWTPVLVIHDASGAEQHRWEGYLPTNDFLAQLELGLAKVAFGEGRWGDAERLFRELAEKAGAGDLAPLAVYYAGVSRYKGGDQQALPDTARALQARYADSSWAKKSSVWLPQDAAHAPPA